MGRDTLSRTLDHHVVYRAKQKEHVILDYEKFVEQLKKVLDKASQT